jgi:hypothetical protein
MSKQKRLIASIPFMGSTSKCTHIDVELYYSKGGMNYFHGKTEARGLYLSAQPLEKGDRFISFTAFSGIKQHVKEMKMFTQKALDTFVVDPALIESMVNHVAEKSGLTLSAEWVKI